MKTMLDFLSGLAAPRLAELVAAHLPDGPAPVGRKALAKFAALLLDPGTVTETIAVLSLPELQVAEALSLRAAGTRRSDLARLLGVAADDADLGMVLGRLEWHALAWPDGEWIRTAPIHEVIVGGYGFGPSARIELTQLTIDRLQRIAYNLDAPVGRDRASLVDGVCAALADAATVRAKFAAAPEATKDLLLSLADDDPFYFDPRQMGALRTNRPTALRWAVDHGMIMWNPAGMAAVLPSEVGVVLRQEIQAGSQAESRRGSAPTSTRRRRCRCRSRSASRWCSGRPPPRSGLGARARHRPAGGVRPGAGADAEGRRGRHRELRRLSKAIGGDDLDMRLWLTLAGVSGLIGITDNRIAPSAYYDDWLKLDPPAQYGELLTAWLVMDAAPLDTSSPALLRTQRDEAVSVLRRSLVSLLNGLPDGSRCRRWRGSTRCRCTCGRCSPGPTQRRRTRRHPMLWRELELMGLGALHAPTGLCRALAAEAGLDGTPRRSGAARRAGAADPGRAAHGAAAERPDRRRDRRPGGAARRVPRPGRRPGVPRRRPHVALLRGVGAPGVRHRLVRRRAPRRAARGGDRRPRPAAAAVPGHRPGPAARALRVRPVGCVLRSEDPTLLAELPRVKSLAALGLTELAPTVYASALPVGETLAALRAAGYAPAGRARRRHHRLRPRHEHRVARIRTGPDRIGP